VWSNRHAVSISNQLTVQVVRPMDTGLARQIGLAAREARKGRQLTQADVAERIGTSVEFYARLERGGTLPSVPTLRRLAVALATSSDQLLASAVVIPPAVPNAPPLATARDRLIRRVVRRLEQSDESTIALVNQLLIGVGQLRDEWSARSRSERHNR
jgi:transcriptional regulator with XRE-family HTH domain